MPIPAQLGYQMVPGQGEDLTSLFSEDKHGTMSVFICRANPVSSNNVQKFSLFSFDKQLLAIQRVRISACSISSQSDIVLRVRMGSTRPGTSDQRMSAGGGQWGGIAGLFS